jgi:sugar (pentulose or hexulose) kinase
MDEFKTEQAPSQPCNCRERLGVEPEAASLGRAYEPDRERTEVYAAARERQRELYRRLF